MISIIPYQEKYNEPVVAFVRSILEVEFNSKVNKYRSPDLDIISEKYQKPGGNFWLAIHDDKIVGTVAFLNMGKNRGYLKRMYLAKGYRGTGLAQKLLAIFLDFARHDNFEIIYLGTVPEMERAIRFYEKHGFKPTSLPEDLPRFGDTMFYKLEL